jgi:hypothetical protein
MLSKRAFFFWHWVVVLCAGACGGRAEHPDGLLPDDLSDAGSRAETGNPAEKDSGVITSDARSMPAECRRTPGHRAQFLLTLSPKPFPTKPNLMMVVIDIIGSSSMQLSLQFFDYSRTRLVGDPVVTEPLALRTDGFFRTDSLVLDVPGEANCALPDTALAVQVTLEGGQICDDTRFACGLVNGVVLGLGVDLDGSTFTLQRVESDVFPQPVLNCERVGVAESCR